MKHTYRIDGAFEKIFEASSDNAAKLKVAFFQAPNAEEVIGDNEEELFESEDSFFDLLERYGSAFEDSQILELDTEENILKYIYDTYVEDTGDETLYLSKVIWEGNFGF